MHLFRTSSLFAAVLGVILLIACSSADTSLAKSAPKCRGLHLGIASHRVRTGGWVRVHGRVCGPDDRRKVKIAVRAGRWNTAVTARVRKTGEFKRQIRVSAAWSLGVARLRAVQKSRRSNAVTVQIAEPSSPGECQLTEQPGQAIEMTLPGCRVVGSDTSLNPDPSALWGRLQCQNASRYTSVSAEGDPHVTAMGSPQPDSSYRMLTTIDGDDFWGERCELGEDDWRTGPTAVYHEGDHRVTYISERLPSNFPLNTSNWQTVMQMKQAQPSDGGGGAPQIEMEAREGSWIIVDDWHELWNFPAAANLWTRFAWNVHYSEDPSKGWIQVSADLNGDGDFNDPGERSPVFHVATLKTEIEGPLGLSDGLAPGAPIPSHLRAGIYHDPAIPCPGPTGCSVDVDNVQVIAP